MKVWVANWPDQKNIDVFISWYGVKTIKEITQLKSKNELFKMQKEKQESDFPKGQTFCKVCKNAYEQERRAKDRAHQNAINKASYEKNKKDAKVKFDPKEKKVYCM